MISSLSDRWLILGEYKTTQNPKQRVGRFTSGILHRRNVGRYTLRSSLSYYATPFLKTIEYCISSKFILQVHLHRIRVCSECGKAPFRVRVFIFYTYKKNTCHGERGIYKGCVINMIPGMQWALIFFFESTYWRR